MKPSADVLMVEFDDPDDIPGNGERTQRLLPRDAHRILKSITDENIQKLGYHPKYARPEWFIWTVLPVPPPPTRPSVEFGSGVTDDDLTHKYINIVKANNTLRASMMSGDPPGIQEEVCFDAVGALFVASRKQEIIFVDAVAYSANTPLPSRPSPPCLPFPLQPTHTHTHR